MRTLIELKSDVNAVDEERKTPLHHASETGKSRIIPILIQNGASLVIKDRTTKKTPLQIAANDKIRELILMYSDPEYDPLKENKAKLEILKPEKQYDQEALKKSRGDVFDEYHPGVAGTKTDLQAKKTPKTTKKKSKPLAEERKGYYGELEELESKGILPFDLRNHRVKLIKLLRTVQEYGIKHNLHKKKKFLFSGSWMEKIEDLTDLMASMFETNSSETALKIFNVLHPYDKPLPAVDEEEDVMKEFYEEKTKFDPVGDLKKTTPQAFKERMAARGIDNLMTEQERKDVIQKNKEWEKERDFEIAEEMISSQELEDIKALLNTAQNKLEDANKEIDALKLVIEDREESIDKLKEQASAQNSGKDQAVQEIDKHKQLIKRLNKELEATQRQLEEAKSRLLENKQEYEKLVADIPEVKELDAIRKSMETNEKQRQLDSQRDKALRFRSGLIFQRALENLGKGQSDNQSTLPKSKDAVKSGDYYLTDDTALIRFLNTVERNQPPSLYQRLLDADVEKTTTLRKSQFTSILTDLKISPQDVMSLQRVAGFTSGRKEIGIDEFIKVIKERGKTRQEIETDTFQRIHKCIRKEGWTIVETFEVFDIDKNKHIDFQEMVDGFKKLKIQVPNKHLKSVFAILDEDGNGQISLKEFQAKVGSFDSSKAGPEEAKEETDEEYYQQMEDQKKAKTAKDKQHSLVKEQDIKQFKDTMKKGEIQVGEDVIKRKQQTEIKKQIDEETKKAYDEELINGELKVQVSNGYDLPNVQTQGYKYFYLVFHLGGTNDDEAFTSKPILYYQKKESFEWSAKVPLIKCHPEDIDDEFNIKMYASKGEFDKSDFVGELFCKWKVAIGNPNQYIIANKYEISDAKNKSKFGKVQGRVMVNVKFIPAGVKDSDFTEEGAGKPTLKDTQTQGTKKVEQGALSKLGDLIVEIQKGKGFEPKVRHKLLLRLDATKNKEMTQTVREGADPEFNEKITIPVYKRETQEVPLLIIQDINPDEQDILSNVPLSAK